jgi:hypothetical protein
MLWVVGFLMLLGAAGCGSYLAGDCAYLCGRKADCEGSPESRAECERSCTAAARAAGTAVTSTAG